MIAITFIDLDHQIIPNYISLPGIPIGIACSFILPPTFMESLIGAVVGAGILLLVAYGYYFFTKKEGMGMGDVKLLAMIGAFLGPWSVLSTIMAASCLGLLMGVGSALVTRSFKSPFGFGPAIAVGALLSMLAPHAWVRLW